MSSHHLPSGAASLAPTPVLPHHLSREPSREDLEMAESLSSLNNARTTQDRHMSAAQVQQMQHQQPNFAAQEIRQIENGIFQSQQHEHDPIGRSSAVERGVSEYHSLADTMQYQRPREEETISPTSSAPAQTKRPLAVNNAPFTGQICS
jgi:GATA-binding protein, other eukaryote